MKKIISFFLALSFVLMLTPLLVSAAGISISLTGPGTARSCDTINLNFNISGNNIMMVQGAINFDSSQLEYKGNSGVLNGWKIDISNSSGKLSFMAEDDKMTVPINGTKKLFTISFSVKARAGAKIAVNTSGVVATDGNNDFSSGNSNYSITVAAQPSGENKLKNLQVKNAAISPAFNANTTMYSASVPFDVNKLDVVAMAADSKASININNPVLIQNSSTNVVITVTAENGSKKTYTIHVKRARDPNYVESPDNNLSSLVVKNSELTPAFTADITTYTVSVPYEVEKLNVTANAAAELAKVDISDTTLQEGAVNDIIITVTAENGIKKTYTIKASRASYIPGVNNTLSNIQLDKCMLSPAFQSDITRYIVWLPYEADVLNATGLPVDPKAKVEVQGGTNLEPGRDNEVKIFCTSEKGETKEYLIIARRALPEGGTVDTPSLQKDTSNGIAVWIVVLIAALCAAGGLGAGIFLLKKKIIK